MFWVNIKIYYFQFYHILCLHIYDVQLNGAVLRCSYITPHFLINEIPVFTIKISVFDLAVLSIHPPLFSSLIQLSAYYTST